MVGQYDRAIADYSRAMEAGFGMRNPLEKGVFLWGLARLHTMRADAYFQIGQDDNAWRDANAALKITPKWPSAMYMRARILREQGNLTATMAELNGIVAEYPGLTRYIVERGLLHEEMGDLPLATKDYLRAYKFDSDGKNLVIELGKDKLLELK